MGYWKADSKQRLLDSILVYNEVQFQRAKMKIKGIETGKKTSQFKDQLLVSNLIGYSILHHHVLISHGPDFFSGQSLELGEEPTQS